MPEIRFSGLNWGGAGPADPAETPATDEEAVATAASYQSPAGSLNTHGGATNGASESKRAQKNGKMTGNNDEYGNRRGKNDSPASRHSTEAPHRRGSKLGTVNDTIRTVSKTTFEKLTHTHINPFNHHHKDQDLAAGHLRAHDIVHVNTGTFTVDTMQRLFYSTPPVVISVALFLYVGTVCIFAAIFVTFGAECFKLEDDDQFGFAPMLWMSIHAFSTIGFGNIAPHQSCVGPQLVLLVETFVSVLTISAIGGYVVKQFLRPLSDVRFSSCFLVNGGRRRVRSEGEGESGSEEYRYLTFRMVRRGRVQLRHIQVQVQAQWWDAATTAFGDRDHHKGRVASLKLQENYFTTLEQLQVWHKLDENSPLWPKRDSLPNHLEGVEVSVSAFDMGSLQNVMMFKRYEKEDLVMDAVFENTLSSSGNPRNPSQLQADHRLLDKWVPEAAPIRRPLAKKKRKSSVTKIAIRAALGGSGYLGEASMLRRRRSLTEDSVLPAARTQPSSSISRWRSRREEASAPTSQAASENPTVSL